MKKILMVLLFAVTGFMLFSQSEEITISRVRIFVDEEEITSEDFDGNSMFSENTILSFTQFRADKKMTLKSLEKEVQQTQLRLLNSGYFYNATVEIVPPRKNPDKRTIIINVTTGFLLRFGGGGIYGNFGKIVIGGKRNELMFYAGWNKNGVSYVDENVGGLPFIAGASIFTNAPSCFVEADKSTNFSGRVTAGFFITPDWRFCVDTTTVLNTNSGFLKNDFIISPYLYNQHFFNEKLESSSEARLYYKPLVSTDVISGELCHRVSFSPFERINFGALFCGGTVLSGENSESAFDFNLNLENAAVSDKAGLSKRCIRSGYSTQELLMKNYVMGSFEARIKALDFYIAKTFPCNVRPFIFVDLAYGQQFFDAYGLGLQLNFECPVFAYFNFTYGVNHLGEGKFCFYTGINF